MLLLPRKPKLGRTKPSTGPHPRKPKLGRTKPSTGPHAARGPWVGHSWSGT